MSSKNLKHILSDLKPNPLGIDIPEEDLLRGTSLYETKSTILKRMILEILPSLESWINRNYQEDPQALKILQEVKKEKSLYTNVNESGWNQFLEDLTGLRPEIHIWKTPPESVLWLADPRKNPFSKRAKELVEAEEEETLLIGWNQYSGLLACEILQGDRPLEQKIPGFPTIRTTTSVLLYQQEESQESICPNAKLNIWAWDKRNFQKNQ